MTRTLQLNLDISLIRSIVCRYKSWSAKPHGNHHPVPTHPLGLDQSRQDAGDTDQRNRESVVVVVVDGPKGDRSDLEDIEWVEDLSMAGVKYSCAASSCMGFDSLRPKATQRHLYPRYRSHYHQTRSSSVP